MDTNLVEFPQLQEVGIFSYFVYSLAKSHFMDRDCRDIGLKSFELSGAISNCCGREQC